MSAMPATDDNHLYQAALALIHGCKESQEILMLSEKARELEVRFPGSGLTTKEIIDYMAEAAAHRGVPFALGWDSGRT